MAAPLPRDLYVRELPPGAGLRLWTEQASDGVSSGCLRVRLDAPGLRKLQPTGVGLTRSVLAAEPGLSGGGQEVVGGQQASNFSSGHAARACPSGEYGVLPAEAPTRGSLADRSGRRVGCSAACGLPGAREAGGRALSRRRRLVRGVRVARVASSAGEPCGPADGRHGTAVLRARNARPAPFVVCRDDRYRGFELLDHHVRRPPRLVPGRSAPVGCGREIRDRRLRRRRGRARARVDAVRRDSPQPRARLAEPARRERNRQGGQLARVRRVGLPGDPSRRAVAEGDASCPPCQRSGRGRSAHAALPGWADPAGGVHRRRSRRISSGRRSSVSCWCRSCFSQVSGERGSRAPRSETCWSISAR